MKKLALALVCLVSVAFFASCDPEPVIENPEPSIYVINEDGFLTDGDVAEMNVVYNYGFHAISNVETQAELAKLVVVCGDVILCDTAISGTEFIFKDELYFEDSEEKEIIGTAEIIATVTDVDGKSNKAVINLEISEEDTLETTPYTWARKGSNLQDNTADEMAAYGLQWVARDAFHANIRPLEGCNLYVILNGSDDVDNVDMFESIETASAKASYFSVLIETSRPVDEYRNISVAVTGDREYNDILAVVDAEGNQHMILIEKANVQTGSFGVWTTVSAQVK